MNKDLHETEELLAELSAKLPDTDADVIVAPTFVNLQASKQALQDSKYKLLRRTCILRKVALIQEKFQPICCLTWVWML